MPVERKNAMEKVRKSDAEWREQLSDEEYFVTRRKGTERAFTGRYWDSKEKGLYRCVACGQELFSSDTKYDSGTGWPSFYAPVDETNVETEPDNSFMMRRTEVVCSRCESHLGHVFEDGPEPTGLRYCINGCALKLDPDEQS
jgi:peptide-methionine (R)-S-oxide reductase